jgi:transketolase
MRHSFFKKIEEAATKDKSIYLLTGDLGFKLFDGFRERYPERFIDVGVAESNMAGISAGLSLSGKNVYCYSIIPFLVMRAYEQIRVDIAYNNLNVKLVGYGAGFSYGLEGFTHFGIEDLSLMRSMPNMNVVVPACIEDAVQLAEISSQFPYPLYIRLEASPGHIYSKKQKFKIGKGLVLSKGKDIAIFAIGGMVYQAKQAGERLKEEGFSVTLVNMHTLKPLDNALIKSCAKSHKAIFTVEEHSIAGGLGSAVSEVLSESSYKGLFERIGIPLKLKKVIGHARFLRQRYGLTEDGIFKTIMKKMRELS